MDYYTGGNTITLGSSDSAVLYGRPPTRPPLAAPATASPSTATAPRSTTTAPAAAASTLAGDSDTAAVNNTGTDTLTIAGTNALLQVMGSSTDQIIFGSSATGNILLDSAASFAGTVAGMTSADGIDLSDFLFSGSPTISGVSGTGAMGTATDVTVTDGAHNVTLALLNQYANQFAVSSSAYTLLRRRGNHVPEPSSRSRPGIREPGRRANAGLAVFH